MSDQTIFSRLIDAPMKAFGLKTGTLDSTDGLVLAAEGFVAGWILGIMRAKNNPGVGWHGFEF